MKTRTGCTEHPERYGSDCSSCAEQYRKGLDPVWRTGPNPDDMARELRAAGWVNHRGDMWGHHTVRTERGCGLPTVYAYGRMKELAQQRERGTVTTPPAGQEEKR